MERMKTLEEVQKERKEKQMKKLQKEDNPFRMTAKCPKCGTTMQYAYGETFVCPYCGNKELTDFGKIREFLEDNGPQPAAIISENTGVSLAIIHKYLREGRIEIPDGSDSYIKCQRCGTDIRYGRYCPECLALLSKDISGAMNAVAGEKPTKRPGMQGEMHVRKFDKRES